MSTLKVNNLQVGQDATATNNFTLYQPSTPNGTVRFGVGNVGSVSDLLTVNSSGNVGIGFTNPVVNFEVGKRDSNVTASDFRVDTTSTGAAVIIGRISSLSNDNTSFRVRDRVDRTILAGSPGNVGIGQSGFSSTNLTIFDGNLVIGTSGRGIDFSATTNSSGTMTSEILSDYEEGTWTPVMKGTGSAGSWSAGSAANGGFYVKVGRQVTCWANVLGTLSGATGETRITGLPFNRAGYNTPTGAGNAAYSAGSIQYWNGISVQAIGPLIDPSNEIYVHSYATNSSSGNAVAVVNGSHNFYFFVTYFT